MMLGNANVYLVNHPAPKSLTLLATVQVLIRPHVVPPRSLIH